MKDIYNVICIEDNKVVKVLSFTTFTAAQDAVKKICIKWGFLKSSFDFNDNPYVCASIGSCHQIVMSKSIIE